MKKYNNVLLSKNVDIHFPKSIDAFLVIVKTRY